MEIVTRRTFFAGLVGLLCLPQKETSRTFTVEFGQVEWCRMVLIKKRTSVIASHGIKVVDYVPYSGSIPPCDVEWTYRTLERS